MQQIGLSISLIKDCDLGKPAVSAYETPRLSLISLAKLVKFPDILTFYNENKRSLIQVFERVKITKIPDFF